MGDEGWGMGLGLMASFRIPHPHPPSPHPLYQICTLTESGRYIGCPGFTPNAW